MYKIYGPLMLMGFLVLPWACSHNFTSPTSPTATPTVGVTSTFTDSPTATGSPTVTSSPTKTPTAAVTATSTQTVTPANSPTLTPTGTPTNTGTATSIFSPTLTPTGTLTPSVTPTVTGTVVGANWSLATSSPGFLSRGNHGTLVYNGMLWVIGGESVTYTGSFSVTYLSDVWNSSDGIHWNPVTMNAAFGPRMGFGCTVFNNQMWVLGGEAVTNGSYAYYSDAWYSTDGLNWTAATTTAGFGGDYFCRAESFGGNMWMLGGSTGYNYSSVDGITWNQVTPNPPSFNGGEEGSQTLVFNNLLWIIGGFDGSYDTNDVWSTSDGTNWTEPVTTGPFRARELFSSTVFNNQMWIIGGHSFTSSFANDIGDVWYSSDGTNWNAATLSPSFGMIKSHTSAAFNGHMWIIGGVPNGGANTTSNIWESQ